MNCFHIIIENDILQNNFFSCKGTVGTHGPIYGALCPCGHSGASSQSTSSALERKAGLSHLYLLSGKCSFLKALAH